ncbi:MAG TPA: hypothetical protein VFG69_15910, partial [Nannocystaceae bacterium]|nr:hypothetical protein [Nannocystaceae bacterium]
MVDLDGFVLRLVLLVPIACATASSGEDQELDAEDLAADAPEESPPPNVAAASEAAIDVSDASPELVEAEQTRQPGSCDDQACAEGDNGKCCQKLSI